MTSYLKFAWRHLWRRKLYTTVILLSLTIGFTCTNLLLSFLMSELSADSFHEKKERTFQVLSNDPFGGKGAMSFIPEALMSHLKNNYPEVDEVCTVSKKFRAFLSVEGNTLGDVNIVSADDSFFKIFDFPLNTRSEKVINPTSIVLSKAKAKAFFGDDEAIGKLIFYTGPDSTGTFVTRALTVSAVLEEAPEKSHLNFDALVDASMLGGRADGNGYVVLNNAANASSLEQKLGSDQLRPGLTGVGIINYSLHPLQDSYFNKANGNAFTQTKSRSFIWVGAVLCFLILFMASFNFINLLLLSFQSRKKETGIKKTLGVSIGNLFKTTLTEVFIYLSMGYALSLTFTLLLLPYFNTTLQTSLPFHYLARLSVMSSIGLIVFMLAVMMVIIAVIHQWRIKPISLMQNQTGKISFNRLLFTVQFVISITMAICAITIIKQMDFVENEPLGFNKNIIELNAPDNDSQAKMPLLKEALLQLSFVESATVSSGNPISGNMITPYKDAKGEDFFPYVYQGDEDFFKTLHLSLIDGELPSASNPGTVINQKLAKLLDMKNPIGKSLPGLKDSKIIGIVKDFTVVSFKVETPPVIIDFIPSNRAVLLSFSSTHLASLLPQIEKVWKKVLPDFPFTCKILQQELMNKYKEETSFYRIVIAFSLTSMVISCFGLFALSWAVVQSRVKEIGIRKVLGARPKDIIAILSITFTKRILMAFLIAAPLGYYLMNLWLSSFVKKIPLKADIFIWSAVLVTIVAAITLGMQTIKAALSNPVEELRRE